MASAGGVIVTVLLIGEPAPVVAVIVADRLVVAVEVPVSTPEVLLAVQPTGMTKLPLLTKALAGLWLTVTFTPPTGAGIATVPLANAFWPPWITEIGVPAPLVTLNDASGGTVIVPPGASVSVVGT